MSWMSLLLILSYRLKQMTYSYVEIQRIAHIPWTRCRIVMWYGSKCRIWYVRVDYLEKSKLTIADKWLISLDHVTSTHTHTHQSHKKQQQRVGTYDWVYYTRGLTKPTIYYGFLVYFYFHACRNDLMADSLLVIYAAMTRPDSTALMNM